MNYLLAEWVKQLSSVMASLPGENQPKFFVGKMLKECTKPNHQQQPHKHAWTCMDMHTHPHTYTHTHTHTHTRMHARGRADRAPNDAQFARFDELELKFTSFKIVLCVELIL